MLYSHDYCLVEHVLLKQGNDTIRLFCPRRTLLEGWLCRTAGRHGGELEDAEGKRDRWGEALNQGRSCRDGEGVGTWKGWNDRIYCAVRGWGGAGEVGRGLLLKCLQGAREQGTIISPSTPTTCAEKSQLTGKDPDAGKDWGQEKWVREDEMVGWLHWLNGHEFEQALGNSEGQGSLVCWSSWDGRGLDTT